MILPPIQAAAFSWAFRPGGRKPCGAIAGADRFAIATRATMGTPWDMGPAMRYHWYHWYHKKLQNSGIDNKA
jgi:hypothetical protein